jgi:hypothetical protein
LYFRSEKALSYTIAKFDLKFYPQPCYGYEWDTNDDCLESLFILTSIENIVILWEALMLEKKIFITSKNRENLSLVSMSLSSLLFPFKWIHVLIPVLPEKLKVFIDAPVPLIIGICFNYNINEFPSDAIVYNLEKDIFEKYSDKMPKLPSKLHYNLLKKLDKFKKKFHNSDDLVKVQYSEDVFNSFIDLSVDRVKFNTSEIRDTFYDFHLNLLKNYEKHIVKKNTTVIFNTDHFLKEFSSTDVFKFLPSMKVSCLSFSKQVYGLFLKKII